MAKRLAMGAMALMLVGAAQAQQPAATNLGWLSGRWENASDGRWTEEVWAEPKGGMMIGFARTGRGERVGEFEFLRIETGADGVPAYLAQPSGRPAVAFRLTASGPNSATFENPAHDYPQRISYRRDGDTLVATISALDGSNAVSFTNRRR